MLYRFRRGLIVTASMLTMVNLPKGDHDLRSFFTGYGAGIVTIAFSWALWSLIQDA